MVFKEVSKVVFVTDSIVGDFVQHIGRHFVSAKIKHFPFDELESAKVWILDDSKN